MENFERSGKSYIVTNDYYLKLEIICIRSCKSCEIYSHSNSILPRFLIIIKNLIQNAIYFSFHFDLEKSLFNLFLIPKVWIRLKCINPIKIIKKYKRYRLQNWYRKYNIYHITYKKWKLEKLNKFLKKHEC